MRLNQAIQARKRQTSDWRCLDCGDFLKVELVRDLGRDVILSAGISTCPDCKDKAFFRGGLWVCSGCGETWHPDEVKLEEGRCGACTDAKVKRAKSKLSRMGARDPKRRLLTPAARRKLAKQAERAMGLLDPCQRQIGKRKCKVLKKDHATYPGHGKMPECPRWTGASAKEQREAARAHLTREREEKREARRIAAEKKNSDRIIREHRKIIEVSQAEQAERKAIERENTLIVRAGFAALKKAAKDRVKAKERAKRAKARERKKAKRLASLKLAHHRGMLARKKKEKMALAIKVGGRRSKKSKNGLKKGKAAKAKALKKGKKKGKGIGRGNGGRTPLPPVGTRLTKTTRSGKEIRAKVVKGGIKMLSGKMKGKIFTSLSGAAVAAQKSLGLWAGSAPGAKFWGLTKKDAE